MINIKTIDEDLIYYIHQDALENFGGEPGYYDNTDSKISSILAQQYPVFGHEQYPTVHEKAAMLLYYFAKGHCFVDANKRVSLQVAIVMLELNGYVDKLPQVEAINKITEIASSNILETMRHKYITDIAIWLKSRFPKALIAKRIHKGLKKNSQIVLTIPKKNR